MTKISEQSFDNGFLADELGSDPSDPPSGTRRIYPKSDGWYDIDDAGAVTGPLGAGGGGGAPTDAKYLTTAANGTLSAEVVIPGLAVADRVPPRLLSANDDEFDSASSLSSTLGSLDTNNTSDFPSHLHLKKNDLRHAHRWCL